MFNSFLRKQMNGGAGESRTPDTQFRKLLLYPSELQPHKRPVYHHGSTISSADSANSSCETVRPPRLTPCVIITLAA